MDNIILILGIAILGGIVGAVLFQKLHIPQVIGYIVAGLLFGESGLRLVTSSDMEMLAPFNLFALGIIGFLVGCELNFETLRKYGRQFSAILVAEGLASFLLVSISSFSVIYMVTNNVNAAIAAGVVFGAIASATDPASTMEVMWEYRSRGILTTTIVAIVALDDALAMTLYGLGTSIARILAGNSTSIFKQVLTTSVELLGAIVIGFAAGIALNYVLKKNQQKERTLALAVGIILLVIGVAVFAEMDVILAAMTLGMTVTNLAPRRSKELMGLVRSSSVPIYVIFFVLVGARLGLSNMPVWLWVLVIFYVVFRSAGKIAGAYIGAKLSKAEPVVRKYTGLGLLPQGGVAVGLSIMASHHLGAIQISSHLSLGEMIIFAVTATTFIEQIIGPPMVKLAVKMAGETGRNITEEDVITSWKVSHVMTKEIHFIKENEPVGNIFQIFSKNNDLIYPVIGRGGKIAGVITLEGLKEVLAEWNTWEWLVAADVMSPVTETVTSGMPLRDALNTLEMLSLEQVAVVNESEDMPSGILDVRTTRRLINEELIRRQQVVPFPAQVPANSFS